MPALQSLVLTDRAATPVDHTYTPDNSLGGVGTVVENSGVPFGNPEFSISNRKTTGGRRKVTLKLKVPVVQNATVNGITVPTVVRTSFVSCEFSFPQEGSLQERKDLVGMFQSAFAPAKVLVNDTLVNLEGVWG